MNIESELRGSWIVNGKNFDYIMLDITSEEEDEALIYELPGYRIKNADDLGTFSCIIKGGTLEHPLLSEEISVNRK